MMEAERDHLPQMYDDFDLAIWDVVLWQCGLLGIRVGEASHPGPEEDHIEDIVGNEWDISDRISVGMSDRSYRQLEYSCFGQSVVDSANEVFDFDPQNHDTLPPSTASLPFARTQADRSDLQHMNIMQCSVCGLSEDNGASSSEYCPTEAGDAVAFAMRDPTAAAAILNNACETREDPCANHLPALRCPLCTGFSTRGPARGLIVHLTRRHAGATLSESACELLHGLERGICPKEGCGALRMFSSSSCSRCRCKDIPRPLRIGDRIVSHTSDGTSGAESIPDIREAHSLPASGAEQDEFRKRVAALPSATLLHIPVCQRKQHGQLVAKLLDRIGDGDADACFLEEIRTKLLLGVPLRGMNVKSELARRFKLWDEGRFSQLLVRAEEQYRVRNSMRQAKTRMPIHGSRARRARQLVSEGAYSKAVASLTSELAILSEDDQMSWGLKLLPRSLTPEKALTGDIYGGVDADSESSALEGRALAGVRFRALSAPGPSGFRPEHLRELTAVRDRRSARVLFAAIAKFIGIAAAGRLCREARWILDSRLVYLRKKKGSAPRPIRIGEVWRRVIAKRLIEANRGAIRKFCLDVRQLGVSIPGGADALIHFRVGVESFLKQHSTDPVAIIDVDFSNAFPSLEWESIRGAIREELPDLLSWTTWCHRSAVQVILPCGRIIEIDRGAEQGDPLGPIYCAAVLAKVARRLRERCQAEGISLADFWYMDDGQIFCRPSDIDFILRVLDEEAQQVGARRGWFDEAKSTVNVINENLADEWRTAYIDESIMVPGSKPSHILGIDFAGDAAAAQFAGVSETVSEIHNKIAEVEDVPAELLLTRKCADICKIVHLLRAQGSTIPHDLLDSYDLLLRQSLERIVGGPIDDSSWTQASLGVRAGGLGLRRARDTALPAFIASRTEVRWLVKYLYESLSKTDLIEGDFLAEFDSKTKLALDQLLDTVSDNVGTRIRSALEEASVQERGFAQVENRGGRSILSGDTLVLPAGFEDEEYDSNSLQSLICSILDDQRASDLSDHLAENHHWSHWRCLRELCDPSTSHDWLWALHPCHGPTLDKAEYLTAIRLRIGAPCIEDVITCPRCNDKNLDRSCRHALLCAIPEATRGHYDVRDAILPLVHLADPSADTETPGLVPDFPTLRPADIFTSAAISGRLAALDIAITSPDATGAGEDCCQAMFDRKVHRYGSHLDALHAQQISYRPMVFSAYGRIHTEAQVILKSLAMRAARRRGFLDHRPLLRRCELAIGVAIWRRAASMVHYCLPRLGATEMHLLFGDGASGVTS